MDEHAFRKQVNASGFPFQLRVEHLVSDSYNNHKWRPILKEHHWANPESGEEGFIDLVLEKWLNPRATWYIIVECKRTRGDGRWIFLNPFPEFAEKHDAYVLAAEHENRKLFWSKHQPSPMTFLSSFCTVPGQSDKNTPMLERISAELLDSIECLAEEHLNINPPEHLQRFQAKSEVSAYIPVIVTNTELVVCQFNPMDVDLSEGILPDNVGEFKTVPYIRFQKSMPTRITTGKAPINLEEANSENQRTIIVAHAPSFPELLRRWDF